MWRLNPGRVLLPLRGVRAASGGGPAELATVSIGGIEAPLHRYRVLVCGTLLLYSSLFQCFRATRRWEIQVVYMYASCVRASLSNRTVLVTIQAWSVKGTWPCTNRSSWFVPFHLHAYTLHAHKVCVT